MSGVPHMRARESTSSKPKFATIKLTLPPPLPDPMQEGPKDGETSWRKEKGEGDESHLKWLGLFSPVWPYLNMTNDYSAEGFLRRL
jgi:hypothetical protein